MERLSRTIIGLAVLVAVAFFVALLFVSILYVVAIVAPVIGLLYAASHFLAAYGLWRSHGRFALPDEGIRVIGTGAARWLAIYEGMLGAGGFLLSLAVPALVFHSNAWVIPAAGLGMLLVAVARTGRRRVEAGTHPIDILPPE